MVSKEREPLTSFDVPSEQLWVRLAVSDDPDLRWLIAGTAHTHPGRFHVCSVVGDLHRTVSYDELVEASPEAELWLDGFLNGQQASLFEFLGSDEALYDAHTDDEERRWREWNDRFLRRCVRPYCEALPGRDGRLSELGAPAPWCFVGDVYRVWSGTDWVPVSPQPQADQPNYWHWPGSACERDDDGHDYDDERFDDRDDLSVCRRCHRAERSA